ncbi:TfoX/Sxy family protein [Roseateles sp.]|uniref:TfoX/Sxy family protein n=1 Tax=Roseateles sp. TaxID=1971397 RepID=UPI0032633672
MPKPKVLKVDVPAGAAAQPPASFEALANLGPRSSQFLLTAGITSFEQLQRLGAVKAYAWVKRVEPKASLNLLWALEGALSGMHWRDVAREHRTSLLLALECCQE